MAQLRIIPEGDPWPFKDMEVGDVVICLGKHAAARAHTYGYSTHKRFQTRTQVSKSGQRGTRIVRVADNTPMAFAFNKKGRRRKEWGFEGLALGESWTHLDPYNIPKIVGAVTRTNRATLAHTGMRRFQIRTWLNDARERVRITVTRIN